MDKLQQFTLKKFILVAFCVFYIILYIVYASAAKHFAVKFISENSNTSQENNGTTISTSSNDQELVCMINGNFKLNIRFQSKYIFDLQGNYNLFNCRWITSGHSFSSHWHNRCTLS